MDLGSQELPVQERLPTILRLHTSLLLRALRCETLHFFHFAEEETGLSRLDKLCLIPAGLERAQLPRQDMHTHGRTPTDGRMVIPSTAWRMRSAAKVKCQPETSDLDREQTGLPRGRCQLQPPQPLHLPASPREESPFI